MKETNLAAMLDALRNSAEGSKQEGNAAFAAGAHAARRSLRRATDASQQATWRLLWRHTRAPPTCQTRYDRRVASLLASPL